MEFLFDESVLLGTMRETVAFAANTPNDPLPRKLETELCGLWDATADPACCKFLCKHQLIPSMEGSLQRLETKRGKEICWGVLSNVTSHKIGHFDDNVDYISLVIEAEEAPEVLQSLRFALGTVCSKSVSAAYWDPLADKCLWLIENALLSSIVQTAADLLSAIFQREPQFRLVRPAAVRALELVKEGGHEEDLATQALLRTVETGVLDPSVRPEELRPLLETLLECLRGSTAVQVAVLEVLEIVDPIIPRTEWPISHHHRLQVAENDEASPEQKRLFGITDSHCSPLIDSDEGSTSC